MVCIIRRAQSEQPSYLGCLSSHFTSTGQGAVDLSSEERHGQVDGEVLQGGQVHLVLQGGAGAEEVQLKTEIMS